ncbi:hypothetical protein HO173_003984 [Letharia columbiana]|uniref:Uncharacterized protein n=1 Tax=Letharia columbiana TaxID=112416 RepID=A0A8H6FZP5_9LECA|nr:uncharacterized protein HO173_003984 [Letharia columbiana]KAF6237783.1 hypothetical protein HO173_003984 [Letharia columbiana]
MYLLVSSLYQVTHFWNLDYSELLSSKRSEPFTLYDDSKGREIHSNLCPSILRTNKQIYEEAICHLYNKNTFLLKLNHKRPILPLFRSNRTPPTDVSTDGEYDDRPRKLVTHPNQRTTIYKRLHKDNCWHLPSLPGSGPIYPHVLCRLAHIELFIGAFSMCGASKDGKFFTHIRKVVLDILRLLAEEEIEEGLVTKKTLRVKVRAKWIPDNLFLGDKGPSLSRKEGQALKATMLVLLKEIMKRRVVEVKEAVLNEALGRNEIKTVDIYTGEPFPE